MDSHDSPAVPSAPAFVPPRLAVRARDVIASWKALPRLTPAWPVEPVGWPTFQKAPVMWTLDRIGTVTRQLGHGLPRLVHLLRAPRPERTSAIGRTDLMLAARAGNTVRVRLLARWSNPLQQDALGRTALMHAARHGRLDAVRALLPYSDPSQQDHAGRTALGHALHPNHHGQTFVTIVRLLAPVTDLTRFEQDGLSQFTGLVLSGPSDLTAAQVARVDPFALTRSSGPAQRPPLDLAISLGRWDVATAMVDAWPPAYVWPVMLQACAGQEEASLPPSLRTLWRRAKALQVRTEQNALAAVLAEGGREGKAGPLLRRARTRL